MAIKTLVKFSTQKLSKGPKVKEPKQPTIKTKKSDLYKRFRELGYDDKEASQIESIVIGWNKKRKRDTFNEH